MLFQVNNGDIDLDRSRPDGNSVCYTAVNPFHVRLLHCSKNRKATKIGISKKREKSTAERECATSNRDKSRKVKSSVVGSSSKEHGSRKMISQPTCKFSVKLGTIDGVWCTPEGKRRRRSRFIEPVDLHSSG